VLLGVMLDDLVCMICISWAMGWEETYACEMKWSIYDWW